MEGDLHLEVEYELDVSDRLRKVLTSAALEEPIKVYPTGDSLADHYPRLPRWPSGLGIDFDLKFGGFQAVTAFGGQAGVGKSTLAMSCALENARSGACVVYFDAENAPGEQKERAKHWHGGEAAFEAAQSYLALNFRWCGIDNRHSWNTMLSYAAKQVLRRHKRVLIVLDSLQTIADEICSGQNMLQVTADLYSRMNRIVRGSDGLISFLVLSELNKEDGVKGGAGKYRATMVLKITRDQEKYADGDPRYVLELMKNRNGPLGGDLGRHKMNWWECRFVKEQIQ
jgi:predicted ATP-dependent serine protease